MVPSAFIASRCWTSLFFLKNGPFTASPFAPIHLIYARFLYLWCFNSTVTFISHLPDIHIISQIPNSPFPVAVAAQSFDLTILLASSPAGHLCDSRTAAEAPLAIEIVRHQQQQPSRRLQLIPGPSMAAISSISSPIEMRRVTDATTYRTIKDAKTAIKEMFYKIKPSISAYDTAWVARVPSPNTPEIPCFPEATKWLLENQLHDGSWGLPNRHPVLTKDALTSTLAAVLALKRWHVGEDQITKGLDFFRSNFVFAMDENQHTPIGFDIIFSTLICSAVEMNINLHLAQNDMENMIRKKDEELRRIYGERSGANDFFLAFVSEGLGKQQDWEMAMKYRRKNGSLFNSPSATAFALCHIQDSSCISYLESALQQFGNAVPAVYPLDTFAQLHLVDMLEKLGIDQHYAIEISSVLDEAFRQWMQRDEEIFADITTCAMAFRLLRGHGYDVSSDSLELCCRSTGSLVNRFGGHLKDTSDALELYRASQLVVSPNEQFLIKQNSYLTNFLEQFSVDQGSERADVFSKCILQEVDDALKGPYHATLDRLGTRKYIEHYNSVKDIKVLKSSFCFTNFSSEVLMMLAREEFNNCQSIHIQEFKLLQRWLIENKLDQLVFSRQKLGYCYFSVASTLYSPELADARATWAKNACLTTVVDDFFDVGSSEEEQINLIDLIEKWDKKGAVNCCSENVEVIFSALHSVVSEIGERACKWQDRSVTSHIVEIWLDLVKSMWKEAEMSRNKCTPTMKEYMSNGCTSFALGPIVLPTLYFIGPRLSEDVIRSSEYCRLFNLLSTCGRLLNDIRGFQRESSQGKLNAVTLLLRDRTEMSKDEAIRELKLEIDAKRRELLGWLVIADEEKSVVPKPCKDVFWKMSKVLHFFYRDNDGFTSKDIESVVKLVLQDPIVLK